MTFGEGGIAGMPLAAAGVRSAWPGSRSYLPRPARAAVEAQRYAGYSEIEIFSNDWWSKPIGEVLRTCIERHRTVV